MTIDLNRELVELNGEPIRDRNAEGELESVTIARIVSRMLADKRESSDPVKDMEMAMELSKSGIISVYSSDLDSLKKSVKENKVYPSLILGQILKELEAQKSEAKEE